jgi:hypothetical protein
MINPKGAAVDRGLAGGEGQQLLDNTLLGEAWVHKTNRETRKRANFGQALVHNIETARRDGSVREG